MMADESSGSAAGSPASDLLQPPALSLPKGGGAIRGMGETFAANPVTGTGSMTVPIGTTAGRSGFGPALALSYDTGNGNGPYGFGWSLDLPAITRKTDKGLPRYDDAAESDVFVLSGAEDLVPVLTGDDGAWARGWAREVIPSRTVAGRRYAVDRYRPRVEGLFARIERWSDLDDPGEVCWRSISRDNVTTWFGRTAESRIADPADPARIFSWLIALSHDDKGNVVRYDYKPEDSTSVGDPAHERNRTAGSRSAQRYLKRIRYGNLTPYLPELEPDRPWPEPFGGRDADRWLFEAVFDYGDHDADRPTPAEQRPWSRRPDPFSSYRSAFEVRTYRTCRRVLMFHHFPGEFGVGADTLVRSTDFTYRDELDPNDVRNPVFTFLTAVTSTGYRRTGSSHAHPYEQRSLPPLEFEYSRAEVQEVIEEVDPASLENLPIGLDESTYRWTDLHGEGVAGILTEQADQWFYHRNLSPLSTTGRFAPQEIVAYKPNVALNGGARLMDLAGDGRLDVVELDGPNPGRYDHDAAEGWDPFRAFGSRLTRSLDDPQVRFVDLDGDGRADVLITEDDAFVWHAGLGGEGFGPARRVARALDEELGPRVVFADGTQSVYLADLSGDGLIDLARIRNGEVCYWPNLGHGRFGAKVTMDQAPWFDEPDLFDQRRIRLADVDGSGTTDLIYLHRDGVRLYFNQSGNSWSRPQTLSVFPRVDDLSSVVPIDLLGNGTTCLVWSSNLPAEARRPLRYVNLMGARKPHLLVGAVNNLGAETRVGYASSTTFYLQDKRDGRPWLSRLPFPVQVVERVETYDHVARSRFVTRYAYHHGCFDTVEREFRGFGLVEQWDTEQYDTEQYDTEQGGSGQPGPFPASNLDAAFRVPPVRTKTWFHTGSYDDRDRVSRQFEREYFRAPASSAEAARQLLLDDTLLPLGLTPAEQREACRALKGSMLRQEVYADDATGPGASAADLARAATPYTVLEQNFRIRPVQPRGASRHAVFWTHAAEALTYHYERNPADPRIQHALTLTVDEFGNVLDQAAIGYGRSDSALPTGWDRDRQCTTLIVRTGNRVTNALDAPDAYRTPLPCEAVTYELTGCTPTGLAGRFRATDLAEADRAVVKQTRILYRRDDLSELLPLGRLESLALPGESYQLALTGGLIDQVFRRPRPDGGEEALLPDPAAVLAGQAGAEGGYLSGRTLQADGRFPAGPDDLADDWWIPSGRSYYSADPTATCGRERARARAHFWLPRRYRGPFGHDAGVDFDAYDLLITRTRDALGNRVRALVNDYRVLQPLVLSDPNRNRSEVAVDILGKVVGTALTGKPAPGPIEGDTLDGFVTDPDRAELDGLFGPGDPRGVRSLLRGASTRIVYDLERFRRTRAAHPDDPSRWQPVGVATLARETHVSDPEPGDGFKIRLTFAYSDGFGREIQSKVAAAPGPGGETRWVGSGWVTFNDKGKPVREFEPFFSDTHRYESETAFGVSPVLFYDPAGRVVVRLHADHTYEKVVFDPWQQTSYDVNDTCAGRGRQTGDPRTDPDIRGFVASYFRALYPSHSTAEGETWQTWYEQRIGGAKGAGEQLAAERAAAHADTPTSLHFDVLGRPFLTVVRNRLSCPGHPHDGVDQTYATRAELDIEGRQLVAYDQSSTDGDERRVVMRFAYDLLGRRLHQTSLEAGARWMIGDAAGKTLLAWDSRGHTFRTRYDQLRRPVEHWVRGSFQAGGPSSSDPRTLDRDLLVDRIAYGEDVPGATKLNLRTRIFQHRDPAGVATYARLDGTGRPDLAYDFKGNLLASTQQLIADHQEIPDWRDRSGAETGPRLDREVFEGATRYDALNRPVQSVVLHASGPGGGGLNIVQPVFDESGLLTRTDVWLGRAESPTSLLDPAHDAPSPVGVRRIEYDPRGQRTRIEYSNGAVTRYRYDPLTFRLTGLRTRRARSGGQRARGLQDLHYTYDPAGNIVTICDEAQRAIFFRNRRVEARHDYVYDATYRLVQAGGREHLGQSARVPVPHSPRDPAPVGLPAVGDAGAFGTYTERYSYDAVGNLMSMRHHGSDPAHAGWTRTYDYREVSAIEPDRHSNRLSATRLGRSGVLETYAYDATGNTVSMPHLRHGTGQNLHWDYRGLLRQVELGGGGAAHHVYDSTGARVRKVSERAGRRIEETSYLGAFEVFRRYGVEDAAILERETLHVSDDQVRIALAETRTVNEVGDRGPERLIRYQLGDHLDSSTIELDESAQIISYEEYAPFGSSTVRAVRSQTETPKRYRFSGKERDEETGFSFHGARYYAPWLGRWTAADPAELADGTSAYVFVRNNPVRYTDETGAQCDPTNATCIDATASAGDPGDLVCRADDVAGPTGGSSSSALAGGAFSATGVSLGAAAPAASMSVAAPVQAANSVDDLLTFLHAQAGFETGAVRPPTFSSGSASPFGTAAHARATTVLDEMKQLGFLGSESIYSEVRVVNGVITQIGGTPGGPKGSHNLDILVAEPGETIAVGDNLMGGVAERIGDLKYGGGVIDTKYAVYGSDLTTITGRTAAGPMPAFPEVAPPPGMSTSTRLLGGAGGVFNAAGGVFMLASVDTERDPGILTAGKITSGTASLAGGGMEVAGAWYASAGLLEAGATLSGVGAVIAAPIIVHQLGKPQGMIAYDPQLVDRAIAEGRNPFCAQCHGPGGALDPNNDWNSRDPVRRAAFLRRLQWVNLDR